jgi:hypothetical protein
VIIRLELRGSDLESSTHCERQPVPEMNSANQQAWRHERLGLAIDETLYPLETKGTFLPQSEPNASGPYALGKLQRTAYCQKVLLGVKLALRQPLWRVYADRHGT